MRERSYHARTILLAGAASLAMVSPTLAQSQTSQDATDLDEIIVTAQKREERLRDVPLAISAVTSESLERSGAQSLRDVVSLTPSVYFSQSQGPVQSNIAIRGVGSSGGVAGLEPSVGVYVDGVYLDRTSIGVADFNDLERIEILRGPQGTLFGKNTPAGLINFITKRPEFDWGGTATAEVGNYAARYGSASITGPLTDTLAFRVSGFYRERDGFLTNTLKNESENGQETWGVRARALWAPRDGFEALFTYEHHQTEQDCCAAEFGPIGATQRAVSSALGRPFPAINDPDDLNVYFDGGFDYSHVINAYTLEVNADIGRNTLTSITSVRDYDSRSSIDGDFSQLDFFRVIRGDRDHQQISQELRLASPAEDRFSWILGAFYFGKEQEERGGAVYGADTQRIFQVLGSPVASQYAVIRSSANGSTIDNKSYAAFGQGTYQLSDTLDVSFGLRYTFDDKFVSTFQTTTELIPVLAAPRNEQASDDDGQWSGMANLRWRPDAETMVYGSLTRGYKAFGFNDSGINTAIGQRRFFDAELSTSGEVGYRHGFDLWNAQLGLTAFLTKFEDYQSSAFAPGNTFLLQNAAELTTKGIEADLTVQPEDGLEFSLSYAYLDAKFDSFPTGPGLEGVSTVQDLSGKTLTDAPEHALSFVGQYDFDIPGTSLGGFVRGEASYRTEVFTTQNLDPLLRQPAYALYNGRVGVTGDGWALEFWGRNLSNEIITYRGATPPAVITTGSRIRFVGDPRTYGVTLRASF